MDDQLKRRNEIEALEILKEFHDYELSQHEPDEMYLWLCKRWIKVFEARHKREDASGS